MRAIGYTQAGPIDRPDALLDLELPTPSPGPNDLRVRVAAVSVNPVDTKVRKNRAPKEGVPEVLGWDAVGVVDAVGAEVKGFSAGDRVYYAGAINRPGTNAAPSSSGASARPSALSTSVLIGSAPAGPSR